MWKIAITLLVLILTWAIPLLLGMPYWIPLTLTVAAALGFGVFVLVRYIRALQAAANMEHALAAQGLASAQQARPDVAADIEDMTAEFQKAVLSLKHSKLRGGGKQALYALPWYAIIGPPGTGKSTAIRNSGLQFPYLSGKRGGAVRGIGGTRNCDWWLSNEGVILDTAGRWSLQEGEDEWNAFLDLLRSHRQRQPLNGIIIAVGIDDLLNGTEGPAGLGKRLRERLDGLLEQLRVTIPVYVLITKCDLLEGFRPFFVDLPTSERGNIWGVTAPTSLTSAEHHRFLQEELEALLHALQLRSMRRMAEERRVEVRTQIFGFPSQFQSAMGPLMEMMGALFEENVFQSSPTFRGLYLTSGTQEGRPFNQLIHDMASRFGIALPTFGAGTSQDAPLVESKSYFLHRIFTDVLAKDVHLARPTKKQDGRRRLIRLAMAGALATLASVIGIASVVSWSNNRDLIDQVDRAGSGVLRDAATSPARGEGKGTGEGRPPKHSHAARVGQGPSFGAPAVAGAPSQAQELKTLHALLRQLRGFHASGRPPGYGVGLYVGDDAYDAARKAYVAAMHRTLMLPLVTLLTQVLQDIVETHEKDTGSIPAREEYAGAYDTLKLLLLLQGPREDTEPPLDDALNTWAASRMTMAFAEAEVLRARVSATLVPEDTAKVGEYLRLYLALIHEKESLSLARQSHLLHRARRVLLRIPRETLALERLRREGAELGDDLDLRTLMGGSTGMLQASTRIPRVYTRSAWENGVKEALADGRLFSEAWVLGDARDVQNAALADKLRKRYFHQYVEEWKAFIGGIRMVIPKHPRDTLHMLQSLTRGSPPPLPHLLQRIHHEVRLEERESDADKGARGFLAKLGAKAKDAAKVPEGGKDGGEGGEDNAAQPPPQRVRDVFKAFDGLTAFAVASTEEGTDQELDADLYQEQLAYLRDALQLYQDDPSRSTELMDRIQIARTRVRDLVEKQSAAWRPRFQSLLWTPIDAASMTTGRSVAAAVQRAWCAEIVEVHRQQLDGKYPFHSRASASRLDDFASLYAPGEGAIWSFVDKALAQQVQREGSHFSFVRGSGVDKENMYRPALLGFLDRAHAISEAFFADKKADPSLEIEVRVRPTPGIAKTAISVGGNTYDYLNGPEKWARMSWPGPQPEEGASLMVKGTAGMQERMNQSGIWGFFKLLERGHVVKDRNNPGALTVLWQMQGRGADVTMDIRTTRGSSPFWGQPGEAHAKFLGLLRGGNAHVPSVIALGDEAEMAGCGAK